MRLVADTHALIWYLLQRPELSPDAKQALDDACSTDGVVVSTALLIDLWYVTRTTKAFGEHELAQVEAAIADPTVPLDAVPVDLAVFDAWKSIGRDVLVDPWDRLLVSTAIAHSLPLVSRDEQIIASKLVEVIW